MTHKFTARTLTASAMLGAVIVFASAVVNPDEPESREAWDVTVKFFDHLGRR